MASNWIKCAFIYAAVILAFIAPFGYALHCYQCSTALDKDCEGDLPKDPGSTHPAYKFLVDCEDKRPGVVKNQSVWATDDEKKESGRFCRKQHQDVEGRINIIRTCGFVKGPRACYSTANPPTKTVVCQCDERGCNSAPGLPVSALALPVLACLMYYFRF